MKKINQLSHYYILILFISLSFLMRFFSFFPSVINHDESTYLVIAKEILKGKVLYSDFTDIKPIGIFYIVAGYIRLFGNSIFGFRMFGAVVIAFTSFLLFKTKIKIGHPFNVAFATGTIYIFFLSVWTYYGISLNTEHFFNLLTAAGLFIILRRKTDLNLLLFGLIMGTGFLIKIVVAFDFIAILLFLFISDTIHKDLHKKRIIMYFVSGSFFLVPFGMVNLIYFLNGHFQDFYHINYVAFRNYPIDKRWGVLILWVLEFFIRFLPISFFFFFSLFSRQKLNSIQINEKFLISLWLVFCLISITLSGKTFGHYMIQMMLPVSFLAGNIFNYQINKPAFINMIFRKKVGYPLIGMFLLLNLWMQKKDYYDRFDYPKAVSNYLKPVMHDEDIIYTGTCHHIIYYLLNTSPPTKYVHRSLLFGNIHYNALEIDPKEELKKIFNKNPRFLLANDGDANEILSHEIKLHYSVLKHFDECGITVYKREE